MWRTCRILLYIRKRSWFVPESEIERVAYLKYCNEQPFTFMQHLKILTPLCIFTYYYFTMTIKTTFSQTSHWYGCSPEWIRISSCNVYFCANASSQILHIGKVFRSYEVTIYNRENYNRDVYNREFITENDYNL